VASFADFTGNRTHRLKRAVLTMRVEWKAVTEPRPQGSGWLSFYEFSGKRTHDVGQQHPPLRNRTSNPQENEVVKDIVVAAEVRTSRGKNEAHRTRHAGQIPAIVYGAPKDPVAVSVSPREISKIIHSNTGYNTIFKLEIAGGETTPVMLVDRQLDPVRGTLLHADFKRIDLTKRIRVNVPVITTGEAKGVKVQGGLLEVITRAIEIECLPDDIPEKFVIDVTELMIGQAKRASDVPMTGSMKLVSSPETVIAHSVALRAEEVVAPTEAAAATPVAGAAAEPEVIKKGKKEEEAEAKDKEKGKKK
jgi:large subunit ribosomal protein L25